MTRNYKGKTTRAFYSEEDLQRTIDAVLLGATAQCLQTTMKCLLQHFRRHRDKKVANPGSILLGRFRPDISNQGENKLVLMIQNMEKALFGLTTKDVRWLAYDFAIHMGIKHRYNKEKKMAR